jgi:hypothetical protein
VTDAIKESTRLSGGDSKSFQKKAPWLVPSSSKFKAGGGGGGSGGGGGPAIAAAPSGLYTKQLKRSDLNALAVIGMGE